jgi:hypothetical protein
MEDMNMAAYRFKGGVIQLNSGGSGPDDYLIRALPSGRYVKVIFRCGRHWTNKVDFESDKASLSWVLRQCERTAVSDNANRAARLIKAGKLVTKSFTEFARENGMV